MKRYFIPTNGETLIYLNHHCLTFFFLVYFLITSMHVYWASLIAQLIKESTCKAEDPNSTPRSGRSPGERIGYPLQYSWASVVAQMLKNPPAM